MLQSCVQTFCPVNAVYGNAQSRFFAEVFQTLEFLGADDLIGDENVIQASLSHDFGFAKFGAGDAHGTRVRLHFGDLGTLVGFGVRS